MSRALELADRIEAMINGCAREPMTEADMRVVAAELRSLHQDAERLGKCKTVLRILRQIMIVEHSLNPDYGWGEQVEIIDAAMKGDA